VLGAKAGKNLIYILSPLFPAGAKQGSFFSLLHYSITPIHRIQLTSALDKKADNCSLPTAVFYNSAAFAAANKQKRNLIAHFKPIFLRQEFTMKCPSCTQQNPLGVKFCGDCGQRMGTLCLSCNSVNLPQSNFCLRCGQFLAQTNELFSGKKISKPRSPDAGKAALLQAATGERKYVTVLFSDLSGYTTLAQRLDPEEVKEITAGLFRETTKVVAKYEGFIEKYVGDAVMAVFGAIRAHEDDPIRAIRAAIEIHELVGALSSDYEKQIGQSMRMHTGINTGLVVTGDVDFGKGTHGIAGATLNLAARLCSLAKPGEVLVGSET
jgi:class 3 adenylate cyclase